VTTERKTPLYDLHVAAQARLIDFGGFAMPVSYKSGVIKEHKAVREAAGIFDVSHMGEFVIQGERAREAVQRMVTGDIGGMATGVALYTVMCYPHGGIVDDLIVYKQSDSSFFLIVNASNREKDLAWIREHVGSMVDIRDESDETSLIAVQGPHAVATVSGLADIDLAALPRFHHTRCQVAGGPCLVARTGYTGEDGFEIACPNEHAVALWQAICDAGADVGLIPCGLGARDTLRLEARLSLYGNDIDETTSPYEAGLGWVVKLDAGSFIGHDVLAAQKRDGVKRKLVGFKTEERGIPRAGYSIVDRGASGDQVIGKVTSGNSGITVGGAIGLGYVPIELSNPGTTITIDCRGRDVSATVVKGPFYKRSE